jgi:Cft2 family RNA processing exonuclease
VRIINLNPDTAIGASAWFLEIEGHRLLMDAGTHPKLEGYESLPLYKLVAGQEVDAIAISHCHHDHVGSLPVAVRHFPRAHVLLTELSYFLVERVLHNSVNVMKRQRDEIGIKEYPLYSHDELDDIAPLFQGFKYNREIEWATLDKTRAGLPSPTLEFYDAGHALGSAGLLVSGEKETLFYTGDVSFRDQTLLKGARFEDVEADVLIMETTRGNRSVPIDFSREKEIERLTEALHRVLAQNGSVLIPTFALAAPGDAGTARPADEVRQARAPAHLHWRTREGFHEIYDLEAHRAHRQHPSLRLTGR